MLKGIDVSKWNGNIDWTKASKVIDFAILRAGYGSSVSQKDVYFEKNYLGCKNNGIMTGVYWYNYAKTVSGARQEAEACLAAIKGKQFEMPIWYDIEEQGIFSTGKNNVSAIARTFCDIIAAAGYKIGIYSSKSGLQSYFTNEVKNKYDIWLANVGSGGATLSKTSYSGKYDIWQYSWKGKVAGISGDVDMDYCYKDYSNKEDITSEPVVEPIPTPTAPVISTKTIDVIYQVTPDGKNWYPAVKNDTDYAGLDGKTVVGFTAKVSEGTLKYRVHTRNGKWLGWISKSDINDWNWGVAGLQGKAIDGLQLDLSGVAGYKIMYRVSVAGTKTWYPWVTGYGNGSNGYAGVYGKLIDKIQIKIVKA